MKLAVCRYAITLSVPKGSVRKGIYFDTASPHHSVRLIEGGDGRKDLLLVSGEEHDQGIKPEEFADYFGRSNPLSFCMCAGQGQGLPGSYLASSSCCCNLESICAVMQFLTSACIVMLHTIQATAKDIIPTAGMYPCCAVKWRLRCGLQQSCMLQELFHIRHVMMMRLHLHLQV